MGNLGRQEIAACLACRFCDAARARFELTESSDWAEFFCTIVAKTSGPHGFDKARSWLIALAITTYVSVEPLLEVEGADTKASRG
jgi:hypothetical protein